MSEHSTKEERTEMPTERRMGQIRKEGQVFFSNDLVQILTLLTGFYMLQVVWQGLFDGMRNIMVKCYLMIENPQQISASFLHFGSIKLIVDLGPYILLLLAVVAAVSVLAVMLQTDWNVKGKLFEFKFSRIHPLQGIKKIFSAPGMMNTLKAICKLCLIIPIAYFALKNFAPDMIQLMHTSIEFVFNYTGNAIDSLFWKVLYVLTALAIFDYFWGRHKWLEGVKMTKDEVKDERKSIEGDELTKRTITRKGMTRIYERIMSLVPKATVVVTNPTHYAIALQYDRKTMKAPIVLAKGKGFIALKIREIAEQSGVPIIERKPLARALYKMGAVGKEIPYELYKATAEVLAYVFRLKAPRAQAEQASSNITG